ncbi:D-inositol 3-phosphate glycosyltransferase [Planctomycetes bacterium Pan216]|uniref:D-inositol 3-phosphate glycosyltransferase n=1 Tax=Kolteria novifilia TaxID=2527975 RepID=A0A518B396_9BACT|nr:D-inositol 3-phosphate glycosyltransferase [Planctomycetes bacterium Pan216]
MHVLFVHQNYPAQFGHIANYLVEHHGYRCTFVSEKPAGKRGGIERVQYKIRGGATSKSHFCSRTFENAIWHTHAVFEALKARPDIKPDLVVGHSGFGSTLFLRELYDCPIINYFEYFYHPRESDIDFRPEFTSEEIVRLRAKARNAMLLLDLENCDAAYSPTPWQRSRLPEVFHPKVRTIFDGINVDLWSRRENVTRMMGDKELPKEMKVVTYVSRGFESMRGFDIFMKLAKRLCDQRRDLIVLVVGEDRICYGGDEKAIGGPSFKDWVLAQDDYDLTRIRFLGRIPPQELAKLFSISDLHVYLTVPFCLSWSLLNALSCGATVLASDTAPVRDVVVDGNNGLLTDFFDLDAMVEKAHRVLDDPVSYRRLGEAAARLIREEYSLPVCLEKMLKLYQSVGGK